MRIAISFALLALAGSAASADTIYLNSGYEVEGKVTEIQPGVFQLQVGDRTVVYRADEIASIEKNNKTGIKSDEEIAEEIRQMEERLFQETGLTHDQRLEAMALVEKLILDDPSERSAAMETLAGLQQQYDVFRFIVWFMPQTNQGFLPPMYEVLVKIDPKRAIPVMRKETQNFHFAARTKAIELLTRLGDRESLPLIVRGLKDHSPEVQAQAAISVGQLGANDASPALIDLLARGDARIVSAAQAALATLWKTAAGETPPKDADGWLNLLESELPKLQNPVMLESLQPLIAPEHEFFFG